MSIWHYMLLLYCDEGREGRILSLHLHRITAAVFPQQYTTEKPEGGQLKIGRLINLPFGDKQIDVIFTRIIKI